MNWSEERYVRLYTRTTADLLAFGWEGRLVWYELLRAADRAGVIDTGGDLDALPDLLRVPIEVFEAGWPRILKRGSAQMTDRAIVIPAFIDAQEAEQSDKQRQRESRARRREKALAGGADRSQAQAAARPDRYAPGGQTVTSRDPLGSHSVTDGHDGSQRVTAGHSVPNRTVLDSDPVPSGVGTGSPKPATPKPKKAQRPVDPDAQQLAGELRDAIVRQKPNHRIGTPQGWTSPTKGSWAQHMAKALGLRTKPQLLAAIAHLAAQTGDRYDVVVECARTFVEKLDQIERAMARTATRTALPLSTPGHVNRPLRVAASTLGQPFKGGV